MLTFSDDSTSVAIGNAQCLGSAQLVADEVGVRLERGAQAAEEALAGLVREHEARVGRHDQVVVAGEDLVDDDVAVCV